MDHPLAFLTWDYYYHGLIARHVLKINLFYLNLMKIIFKLMRINI